MSHAVGNNDSDDYTDMNDYNSNNNNNNSSNKQQQNPLLVQQDLDAFLSLLEAKLRGPFSSLDLAKTIITNQLRNGSVSLSNTATNTNTSNTSITKEQYIETIGLVLGRAEKTTQLRTLIGFLGLDPSNDQDTIIKNILSSSQQKELYVEEWVRIISGLVHGIMYASTTNSSKKRKRNNNDEYESNDEENDTDDEENDEIDEYNNSSGIDKEQQTQSFVPLRGEEADMIITKTCTDIINRVRTIEQQTDEKTITNSTSTSKDDDDNVNDNNDNKKQKVQEQEQQSIVNSTLYNSDVDTTFVPYWYTLVNEELLEQIIRENTQHYHFTSNDTTNTNIAPTVLTMDTKIEIAKAQEEYDHALQTSSSSLLMNQQQQSSTSSQVSQQKLDGTKRKFDTAAILPGMNRKLPPTNNSNSTTNIRRTGTVGAGRQQQLQSKSTAGTTGTTKSSLFLPSNKRSIGTSNFTKPSIKPSAAIGTGGVGGSVGLKLRKPGAAQDLLKSRKIALIGNNTTTGTAAAGATNAKITATTTTTTTRPTMALAGRNSTFSKVAGNNKNSNAATNSSTTTTKAGTTSLVRGRANRLLQNGGTSKVKMMDTDEINDLEQAKLIKDQQQLPNSNKQQRSSLNSSSLLLSGSSKKIKLKGKSSTSKSTLLDNNNDSNHSSNDKSISNNNNTVVDDGEGGDDDIINNSNDNDTSPKQRKRQKLTGSMKGDLNEVDDINSENNMKNNVHTSTTSTTATGLSIHNDNFNGQDNNDNDNDPMEDNSNHTSKNNGMNMNTIATATTTMFDNVNNNSHINKGTNSTNTNTTGQQQYSFATDPGALAAAALNMYQAKMSSTTIPAQQLQQQQHLVPATLNNNNVQQQQFLQHHNHNNTTTTTNNNNNNNNTNKQSYVVDWRKIIQETSNKLSNDDKFRIQQFFVDKYNPTPEQTKIKLKLHEIRTTDTKTGEISKETHYLELDYITYTSHKSKKTKKYSN